MPRRYRTTVQADEDIFTLYVEGVRQFGVRQAETYLARLLDCCALLAEQPGLGRRHADLRAPVRVHFHDRHVIAYSEADDGILVIRVLYARADWANLL